MALMPRLNALKPMMVGAQPSDSDPAFARGDLQQRAEQFREGGDQAADDAALADGGTAARQMSRINNMKARTMAMNNPDWDPYFQAVRDAGGGAPVRLVGGPSPDGSNQIAGIGSSSLDALHGRVRQMPDSHDVWRAKTRQRIFGEA